MPHPVTRNRRQSAVVWYRRGYDNAGRPKVSQPEEIKVRWLDVRRESVDPQGNSIATDASLIIPEIDVPVGSMMWKGCLVDIEDGLVPSSNVYQVIVFNKTPTLKAHRFLHEVSLMRYTDQFPEILDG